MKTLYDLTIRNIKMFFKDKGTFLTSLIAPIILLVLFITFLGNVYRDSFLMAIPQGMSISDTMLEGFVGGFLLSSLLAVCCITVAFSANMQMVQDKVNGSINDFIVSPVKKSTLALSYYITTAIVTAIICYATLFIGFIYLAIVGWFLSFADVLFILLDVLLLVLFGTALSSVVCYFIKSQGGMSAISVLMSSIYGFICGAYMPISQFSSGIQNVITCLPGTYGTGLLRNHFLGGVLCELKNTGFPSLVVEGIKDAFDNNIYFFGNKVEISTMFIILSITILLLVGIFIIINLKKKNKK